MPSRSSAIVEIPDEHFLFNQPFSRKADDGNSPNWHQTPKTQEAVNADNKGLPFGFSAPRDNPRDTVSEPVEYPEGQLKACIHFISCFLSLPYFTWSGR